MSGFRWLARLTRPLRRDKDHYASAKARVDARAVATAGNAARDSHQWLDAVAHYRLALALSPEDAPIQVQLGHAFKELGRLQEAEVAYRTASSIAPEDGDIFVQLGHVLKLQGRLEEATSSYANAVRLDPTSSAARSELIAAGGRSQLPDSLYGQSATTDALARLALTLDEGVARLRDLALASTFPVEAYHAFRKTFPIVPPPPWNTRLGDIQVRIYAFDATPADLRLTLTSLINQRIQTWTAVVAGSARLAEGPVASMAYQDPRISFSVAEAGEPVGVPNQTGSILVCDAGVDLDPDALGWFATALEMTGAAAVYADHDHHHRDWRRGAAYAYPAFQSSPDRFDIATTPTPPAVLLLAAQFETVADQFRDRSGAEQRREILLNLLGSAQRAAHVPRVLSSVRLAEGAEPEKLTPPPLPVTLRTEASRPRILVIIPTRDEPAMLRACLESLRTHAADPGSIDVLVMDNRSELSETADLLAEQQDLNNIRVQPFDEPFNWARANNIGAKSHDAEILLFANNDLEMLTPGWDDLLREAMAQEGVGIVGARLLYPDRTIQHAGVVLGANDRRPVHEGLGSSELAGGPLDRWLRRRQAAAVTGAFMAVGKTTFAQVGGFDERLAVGYNDIDFCLRVRAVGLAVVYEPSIEVIHHESKTRGRNDDGMKTAWDDEELAGLYRSWGDWLFYDPGKNPQWLSASERPFDGLRNCSTDETVRWLRLSARSNPWSVDPSTDERSARGWILGDAS